MGCPSERVTFHCRERANDPSELRAGTLDDRLFDVFIRQSFGTKNPLIRQENRREGRENRRQYHVAALRRHRSYDAGSGPHLRPQQTDPSQARLALSAARALFKEAAALPNDRGNRATPSLLPFLRSRAHAAIATKGCARCESPSCWPWAGAQRQRDRQTAHRSQSNPSPPLPEFGRERCRWANARRSAKRLDSWERNHGNVHRIPRGLPLDCPSSRPRGRALK
jgi:hypothetical protein